MLRSLTFLFLSFLLFTSSVEAQEVQPYRFQLPVEMIQDAIQIQDSTYVQVTVDVFLDVDEAIYASGYQRGVDDAIRSMESQVGSGVGDSTPTWARLAWMGIGVAGVIVIARGLNKIARSTGTTVEGDDIDIIVEPPIDHEHEPQCWPPGHCKKGG